MSYKQTLIVGFIAAGIMLSCAVLSCTPEKNYIEITGYAQGGAYSVKLNLADVHGRIGKNPAKIKSDIDSILLTIDTTASGYNKGSMLSRFNRGEEIHPNNMFRELYEISYGFWKETGGAFDVASAPLFDMWGFGFTRDSLPAASEVEKVLEECGTRRLKETSGSGTSLKAEELLRDESDTGRKPMLNFNAIAQGYSCDAVARYLYGIGVKDMLVNIGEIFCDGKNPGGLPWSIAVDSPVDGNMEPGKEIAGIWKSSGGPCGIVTSGNYRKFYIREGRKYAHTIDPRSGYPVEHSLLSATIVAPDATTADAYATACMVMGLEAAKDFLSGKKGVEAYLIFAEGEGMQAWASDGFFSANQ